MLRQRLAQTMFMTTALDFQHMNSAMSGRGVVWESAGRMLVDRPWTGVGAAAFKKAYDTYSNRPEDPFRRSGSVGQVYHAHQLYVAVAAETGWPGLLGVVGIWYLCIRWWREANPIARREAKPYAVGLLAAVFPLNSQPVLLTIWWFPILLLLLAMMLASLEGDRDSHVTPQPPPPVGTA
jgi:O-antigen ligase